MALKKREKILIGVMLLAGGIFTLAYFAWPQWEAVSTNQTKLSDTKTATEGLLTQKQALQTEVDRLKKEKNLPLDVVIRRYTPTTRQAVVKEILDEVVNYAAESNNKLISLEPYNATPIVTASQEEEDAKNDKEKSKNKSKKGSSSSKNSEDNPDEPKPSPLTVVGYEMSIRGTYDSIQNFLARMEDHKDLIEVSSIDLLNEAGPARKSTTKTPKAILDPSRPIRLNAKLRLILQSS